MRWLFVTVLCLATVGSAQALDNPVRLPSDRPFVRLQSAMHAQSASPNDAVIAYDAGPAYFFPDAAVVGSLWGVRFTPLQTCSLLTVHLYAFSGGGQVRFHFCRDNAGLPGTEFAPTQTRTITGNLSEEIISLTPIDVGAGDFYVLMELLVGPPPYPVTDADGGTGRSWFKYPGDTWEHVVDFDINIRAGVRYYGADLVGPEVVHIPVSLGFSEELTTEIRCGLNDLSGISKGWVYYRTQGASTFDSTVMTYQTDNEWAGEILSYPANTYVEYYLRAYDNSGTQNLTVFPSGAPATVFTFREHPGREMKYDDGYPEMFFYLDTIWTGNAFAVRMTPPVYPSKVNLLRAFVSDTTSFDFEIRARVGDSVGGLLAGPFRTKASAPFTWVDFVIPDGSQPTITSGDFMMVFRWKSSTPEFPAVGADSVVASDQRSYSYDGAYGWYKYTQFDWLMRAAVATPTGVIEIGGSRPQAFTLEQNAPNPFNPSTRINFALAEPLYVSLSVFNLLGQRVRTLLSEQLPAGQYAADFDGRDANGHSLPSGLYFYRLDTDRYHETRKMVLMK